MTNRRKFEDGVPPKKPPVSPKTPSKVEEGVPPKKPPVNPNKSPSK